jgi:diguanylate cyclase (GGDEF)-like protein
MEVVQLIEDYNNIYIDPLTGLPNFFKFIESDTETIFNNWGSVIIFDIIDFTSLNNTYGRDAGDFCLITLANIISSLLLNFEKASLFRTGGDEFTIILPNVNSIHTKELIEQARMNFKNATNAQQVLNTDFNVLLSFYNNKITSAKEFYQMIFKYSLEQSKNNNNIFEDDKWIGDLIENFTKRIQETLSLFNNAYNLALTDDISGLPNQRAAKVYLKNLIEKQNICENCFSILFIDGDNLKRYNKISYESGNEMIKGLAQIIANSLRKNDKVFRWLSGDEFLVVLDNIDSKDTLKLADRIRQSVETQTKNWPYPITISIGVAYYPDENFGIEEIIRRSEKANSAAKNSGKNKVVEWNSSMES